MTAINPDSSAEMVFPRLSAVGLSGILVSFSDTLNEPANRAALAFRARLEAESWAGVEESAASLTSVYVEFDPRHIGHQELRVALTGLLESEDWFSAALPQKRRLWRIPTVFGGAMAPQLDEAAALAGVSSEQAVAQFSDKPLRVMTIGFAPGQPYLGQLSNTWDIPRQSGLTPKVPVGALAVAIRQLVLFPTETPTGWRHIGQTAFRAFQPESDTPFVLRPGDEILFHPIDAACLPAIGDGGGATCEEIR